MTLDIDNPLTPEEKARYLIEHADTMVIATADSNGKPWISPVGFQPDENNNLYWVSSKEALHSQSIRTRPEVAIVIVGDLPDGSKDGVYFDAIARELNDGDELSKAIEIFAKRHKEAKFDVHSAEQVTGDAIWRIYKAEPVEISKRDDTTIKGQAVTIRAKLVLEDVST